MTSERILGKFYRCSKCGNFGWLDEHICPPVWRVGKIDSDPIDDMEVYARDAQEAAEQWAKLYDKGDYRIAGGHEAKVRIRDHAESDPVFFEVTGEAVPEYTAWPLEGLEHG